MDSCVAGQLVGYYAVIARLEEELDACSSAAAVSGVFFLVAKFIVTKFIGFFFPRVYYFGRVYLFLTNCVKV